MGATPSFSGRMIAAFEAGRAAREARERQQQEAEDRKLRLAELKMQQDRLKHEQNIADFMTRWNFQKQLPAQKLPGADFGEQPSTIPGGVPIPARIESTPLPNLPMAVPDELGGGMATPPTPEQESLRQRMELLAQEKIKAQFAAPTVLQPGAGIIPRGGNAPIYTQPFKPEEQPKPTVQGNFQLIPDSSGRLKAVPIEGMPDAAGAGLTPYQREMLGLRRDELASRVQARQNAATAKQANIPQGIKKDLATIDSTLKSLDAIGAKAKLNPNWTGGLMSGGQNIKARIKEKLGAIPKDQALFRKEVLNDLVAKIHELSGAAVSPSEAERLLQALPNLDMSAPEFQAAVDAVKNQLARKREALIAQFSAEPQSAPQVSVTFVEQPDGSFAMEQ